MRFTHYCQGIFGSWPCQQTELENICRCMYINTSNYTYIHTNAFTNVQCTETGIHTNTYFRNHEFTQIPQIPIQHPKKVLLVCFFFLPPIILCLYYMSITVKTLVPIIGILIHWLDPITHLKCFQIFFDNAATKKLNKIPNFLKRLWCLLTFLPHTHTAHNWGYIVKHYENVTLH